MIYIGNDIVEISRVSHIINRYGEKFLNKIFSSKEIHSIKKKNSLNTLSGKFAAKEASAKALMSSGILERISFKDIEILTKVNGAPFVELNNAPKEKIRNFKISISHTDQYATAVALVELF
tara:strand:- start:3371 stop:3733 length:363 start_codon:yes stop_codon:yes gene_type:complete